MFNCCFMFFIAIPVISLAVLEVLCSYYFFFLPGLIYLFYS